MESVESGNGYLLLLLLFVALLDALAELLQALAVVQLDLGPSPEVVLQLLDDRHLGLYSQVKAAQLLVQLLADVWGEEEGVTKGGSAR